jgi:2,3-bisphosphoglycerate-independent phosphoglycerate mutase
MADEDGNPLTAHSTNPVPLIYIGADAAGRKLGDGGALCDISPTLLAMMGIPQPKEMTGQSLFR